MISLWRKSYNFTFGYPNQQQYRYRSTGRLYRRLYGHQVQLLLATGFRFGVRLPTVFSQRFVLHGMGHLNDKITLSRKLTLNTGIRFDRYSSALPEQGNPGTGPFAGKEPVSGAARFPWCTTRGCPAFLGGL